MSYHNFLKSLFGYQYTLHASYLHGIHMYCLFVITLVIAICAYSAHHYSLECARTFEQRVNALRAKYTVTSATHFLQTKVHCKLIYEGPFDVHQHIRERTVYACSVLHMPSGKILSNVFPIMLGSNLDLVIRHRQVSDFKEFVPTFQPPLPQFEKLDIGRGFFIILGFLRQLPYFFTNDPSRTHVQEGVSVCVFTYDALDRGKKLSYYTHPYQEKKRGHMTVTRNDGSENPNHIHSFFDFCPYPTQSKTYMANVYRCNKFDIDSLTNKFVISPGHLFTKLFVKYLYTPLRLNNWIEVKKALAVVIKSIESGCLLHVLSRKTTFQKEGTKVGKMTQTPQEQQREIGADGEIFVEKSIGCYREVNMQTYPLNPFLNYMIVRQISSKVKADMLIPFHPSYVGYLCILGCFETKNVGRTTMMVRDTIVSTCNALEPVFHDAKHAEIWNLLRLQYTVTEKDFFVVVNEASIPVTEKCFRRIDLLALKRNLRTVECYVEGCFIHITYKMGLFFKPLQDTDIWVTPKDILYWSSRLCQLNSMEALVHRCGFPFLTSYHTDLNPFFNYNYFPKDILAFNALKNAVLAMDNTYHLYFMDSLSAYAWDGPTSYHQTVQKPDQDGVSPFFELKIPKLVVSYMNFQGSTQEDSIVCRKDVTAFHCRRFFSIRVKLEADGLVRFQPIRGDVDDNNSLLGTLVHFGETPLVVEPFSIHVSIQHVTPQTIQLFFRKTPFRVLNYTQTSTILTICVEQDHLTSTGDKVCTFHGQKGVMTLVEKLPLFDGKVVPDLIVNAYCLFRMTMGQIMESRSDPKSRDSTTIHNVDGQLMEPGRALYGLIFYFPISYWAIEHFYAPRKCTMDKIYNQPVKGRSRCGGMRLGNMELLNGLRAQGLGSCFETKFFEHGDRVPSAGTASVPKAVELVQQDGCYFKCYLQYKKVPSVFVRLCARTRICLTPMTMRRRKMGRIKRPGV